MMRQILLLFSMCLLIHFVKGQVNSFPLNLSDPYDYDTIVETEPMLVWQTNLTAILSDPRYSQRLILCELLDNQTKSEAIQINQPLVLLDELQNTIYTYNSTSYPLQSGHTYVWQVSILFNGLLWNQSEIYQFTIFEEVLPSLKFYPAVSKKDGQLYEVQQGKIGLTTSDTGALPTKIDIIKNDLQVQSVFLKEYVNGEILELEESPRSHTKRFFILDVDALNLDPGMYSVEWNTSRNRTIKFSFKI